MGPYDWREMSQIWELSADDTKRVAMINLYDHRWGMYLHKDDSIEMDIKRLLHAVLRAQANKIRHYREVQNPFKKQFIDEEGNGRAYVYPTEDELPIEYVRYHSFNRRWSSNGTISKDDCVEVFGWEILSNTTHSKEDPNPGNVYDEIYDWQHILQRRYGILLSRLQDAIEHYVRENFNESGSFQEVIHISIGDYRFVYEVDRYEWGENNEKLAMRQCKLLYETLSTGFTEKEIELPA